MFRKRKQPTPGFRLPPPYQPITGERAPLRTEGVFPYAAMMQVAAEDTKKDYVICRGFDVRIDRFIDYEAGNSDKPGIAVAKPYGKRRIGTYELAQVFAAILPLQSTNPSPDDVNWRVRQNPGVATDGHPATLSETIDELYDAAGKLINYMLIDGAGGGATMINAVLVGRMTCEDVTGTITDVVALSPPLGYPEPTVVQNVERLSGSDGDTLKAVYNENTELWEIINIRHHLHRVVDECVRVDCQADGSLALESHFMDFCVQTPDEIGWESCVPVNRCETDNECGASSPGTSSVMAAAEEDSDAEPGFFRVTPSVNLADSV